MRILSLVALIALAPMTSGCMVASAAGAVVDVATLPVKAVGKAYDVATTSQAEADQNRGRAMRKAEEAYGKELEAWSKECEKRQKRGQECDPKPEFKIPN